MPLYKFKCDDCGHKFEAMTSFSQINETVCPECKSNHCKKLVSNFSSGGSCDISKKFT